MEHIESDSRSVIDFDCGNGHLLQRVARMGASAVFGVDNSVEMIMKAQAEWKQLRGCIDVEATFGMVDCIKAQTKDLLGEKCGHFDYAISHYVTGRCETKDELKSLLSNIFLALKPGGKACLCVPQMMHNKFSKYLGDACVQLPADPKSGVEMQCRNFYPFEIAKGLYDLFAEPLFTLENYLWSVEAITAYLEAVGFTNCKRLNLVYPAELTKHKKLLEALVNDDCGCLMIGAEKPKSDLHVARPVFAVTDQHF